ncbi:MAG: UbiA family prenyltransferase [Candidatus Micrarchaeaceae archaeon]
MDRITAFVKLTRIEHSFMLVIAVIAAELLAGHLPTARDFILSIITPILISMGSFAVNDYYDVETDRANKRFDRPLVNGSMTKSGAINVVMVCLVIGVFVSLSINVYAFIIALVFAVLAVLYSYRMKDIALLGNVYIAFSMVIPFIYGSYVVSSSVDVEVIFISMIIFLAGLAREIHGMIRDYSGDKKARKSRNLLHYTGIRRASQLAFILYIESILISLYMFFFIIPFAYNLVYIVPIVITDAVLAYIASGFMLQEKSKSFFSVSRNASLAVMGLALLAFLASALVYIHI